MRGRSPEVQKAWDEAARNAKGKIGKEWYDAWLPAWQAEWEAICRRIRAKEDQKAKGNEEP